MATSKKFSLDRADVKKLGTNAALVGLAASVGYIVDNFGELDLGASTVVLVPIVAAVGDAVLKWLKNNEVTGE